MDCARRRLFHILVVEDQPDGRQFIRDGINPSIKQRIAEHLAKKGG